jgi:hypothetical protein
MLPILDPRAGARAVTAIVEWLGPAEGGRQAPPGPQYVAPAKILASPEKWDTEAWSLVVQRLDTFEDRENRWLAKVFWLVPEAPESALTVGERFELHEGRKCVARVVVTGEARQSLEGSPDVS